MPDRTRTHLVILGVYGALIGLGLAALNWFTVVRVAGGSMLPALSPGDVVMVARRQPVVAGDIALLRSGRSLVLHRVTGVLGDGSIETRGDANPVADFSPTPAHRVRGRVVSVLPAGKALARWRAGGAYDTLPAQPDTARQ